jgi:hypothetical protein
MFQFQIINVGIGTKSPFVAFSSEVDAGWREENALKQKPLAFSSEVDTGSREQNTLNQKTRASALIQLEPMWVYPPVFSVWS